MVGTAIEANYRGKGKWFPGTIAKVHANGTYNIKYADGDAENNVLEALVRAATRRTGTILPCYISPS